MIFSKMPQDRLDEENKAKALMNAKFKPEPSYTAKLEQMNGILLLITITMLMVVIPALALYRLVANG